MISRIKLVAQRFINDKGIWLKALTIAITTIIALGSMLANGEPVTPPGPIPP